MNSFLSCVAHSCWFVDTGSIG